jgi:hypothetical protein
VTKDSAEVIEIGWVVVDAKNPEREVCERAGTTAIQCGLDEEWISQIADMYDCYSCTANPSWSDP